MLKKSENKDKHVIHTRVNTFVIEKLCEKCMKGVMVFIGQESPLSKNKWTHVCSECKNQEYLFDRYPRVDYQKVVKDE